MLRDCNDKNNVYSTVLFLLRMIIYRRRGKVQPSRHCLAAIAGAPQQLPQPETPTLPFSATNGIPCGVFTQYRVAMLMPMLMMLMLMLMLMLLVQSIECERYHHHRWTQFRKAFTTICDAFSRKQGC
jgi:hypothetical protein